MSSRGELKIFACRSGELLGQQIIDEINKLSSKKHKLGKSLITNFHDGELRIMLDETIRGKDVFIIQCLRDPSSQRSMHDNYFELFSMIKAAKTFGANDVTAVVPYSGYARQDRSGEGREPINAELVASLIIRSGATSVITMDIHSGQQAGFYSDIRFDNLPSTKFFADHLKTKFKKEIPNMVIISPDVGGAKKAKTFAEILGLKFAIMGKTRRKPNEVERVYLVGEEEDVKGKFVVLIDDILDTGGTIESACRELIKKGARGIIVYCTHLILSNKAKEKLSKLKKEGIVHSFVGTNTIVHPDFKEIEYVGIQSIFAKAINNINEEKSVSSLYKIQ